VRIAVLVAVAVGLAAHARASELPAQASGAASAAPADQAPRAPLDDPSVEPWHPLFDAAGALSSLTPLQQTRLQALVRRRITANADVRAARSLLLSAVADAMDSGNVSQAAVAPAEQQLASAMETAESANRRLLEDLHTLLTPAQRSDLVSRARPRIGGQQDRRRGDGTAAYYAGWVSKQLDLTTAQEVQIEETLRTLEEGSGRATIDEEREEGERVLDAFEGGSFVMRQVVPARSAAAIRPRIARVVAMARAVAPVLTTEQRALAVSKLRTWAARSD